MIAWPIIDRPMPVSNRQQIPNKATRLGLALTLTMLLAVGLSAACKKPAPRTMPASATPSPISKQPIERTAEEIALIDAAIQGDTAAVKALLDHGVNANSKDPEGRTPLTEAAFYGHTEIAKLLLDHGADIFAKKAHGETAYDMAAAHQDIAQMIKREIDLLDAATKGDLKLVKELLGKGAYVNVRDPDGRTPLTEAIWSNNVELVKLLLEHGANPNSKKNDGATPLSIALGRAYGQPRQEIVELLKKAGAK